VACLVLILTSVTALAPVAAANDDLKDRQRTVRGQISRAQGDLHESSKALNAAARRLERARAALGAAQRRLTVAQRNLSAAARVDRIMQLRLQRAEHALAVARRELDEAKARLKEQRRQIGELAATNYAYGDPQLMGLTVVLNSQNPAEATSQLNTVDSLMNRQDITLKQLRVARQKLAAQEQRVEEMTAAVAERRKEAAANLVKTRGLQQRAAEARAQVAVHVARNRAARAAAARARAADARVLRALKRQEDRIKQQIIERARRQKGGFKGDSGGFLHRPVPGAVTSPYGWREHPIYGYWGLHDGTDFRAGCGETMRAAGSGRVVNRYWSDVYGNRLYLDLGKVNGRNMTVVYNHATGYRYGVGAKVQRGEKIGSAGSTGWSTGCHLHFTVLLNGNPTDPMKYM
jgi:murein DD-endopeptidase MepM/ murein hydrolase activator NlpD